MEIVVIVAAAVLVAFAIATGVLRSAQVRFRSRQWAAVQQLSAGAVVYGIYESPAVLEQLNHVRATTVPPLPPMQRERRPLAVSVSDGEIAVWRGNAPPGRVVSIPTSALRSAQVFGGDSNAAQATVLLNIVWQNQILSFHALLFEGHMGGSKAHRARIDDLQQQFERFVSDRR